MIHGLKTVVVMPAFNAERTLRRTSEEVPRDVVDEVILVDDGSADRTAQLAGELGLTVFVHPENRGYGANQKTCYALALDAGADIVVMLHPDYQYSPRLITAMAAMIASGHYDIVLGSRILGMDALRGGMPLYKYLSNRALTMFQNVALGQKLSEYHTGFRAYSRRALATLPILENSDDFVFDNQILVQAVRFGFRVGEISCPTRYLHDSSSISFRRSVVYGLGVVANCLRYRLHRHGVLRQRFLDPSGRRLGPFQAEEGARESGS